MNNQENNLKKNFTVLFFGDVAGEAGLQIINKYINKIKLKYNVSFTIANCENVANQFGITCANYSILKDLGIDAITLGNHAFAKKDIYKLLDKKEVIVPLNWTPIFNIGSGSKVFNVKNKKIRVTNLIGRTFMNINCENPYITIDKLINNNKEHLNEIHIIDYHAEATAEKIAFAYNYDGKISALIGTHTHVQTSDSQILPKGSGFICDAGFNGSFESVIGVTIESSIMLNKTNIRTQMISSTNPGQINAVILKFNNSDNKLISINRIYATPKNNYDLTLK